jgi:phosphohistidine phosphatase
MKLLCVRHGLAESFPDSRGERLLTPLGRLQIQKLADYLKTQDIHLTQIRHSHKSRAMETAKILASTLFNSAEETEACLLLDPDARSIDPLLALIQTSNENMMLVGHLPMISHLVSTLITTQNYYEIVDFKPGTVACLERRHHDHWALDWAIHPGLLIPD